MIVVSDAYVNTIKMNIHCLVDMILNKWHTYRAICGSNNNNNDNINNNYDNFNNNDNKNNNNSQN